jgi:hypothetical protein
MLTQNWPVCWINGQVEEDALAQKRMSGGSSETDVNEFTAMPTGPDEPGDVTTATPVAK